MYVYLVVGFDREIFACYDSGIEAARHAREWNIKEGGYFYRTIRIPVWKEATYRDFQED